MPTPKATATGTRRPTSSGRTFTRAVPRAAAFAGFSMRERSASKRTGSSTPSVSITRNCARTAPAEAASGIGATIAPVTMRTSFPTRAASALGGRSPAKASPSVAAASSNAVSSSRIPTGRSGM